MIPFLTLLAPAVVLEHANIDTDQIIPARFLRKPPDAGYGGFLFHDLRRREPCFPLDRPDAKGAAILIAGANFGCGSSREGAVYALLGAGFRAVIAPSFGDIFASNAAKNGLLTIALPASEMASLIGSLALAREIGIDLPAQTVRAPDMRAYHFEIDPFRKQCLLQGLDDIALTLAHADAIAAYEQDLPRRRPWAIPHVRD